ncbi:hypothetical protein LIA77_08496 [Sarocladium implicatum]|nr:hypothetical protein LIA77_08496 [Sarocladium implicatum]
MYEYLWRTCGISVWDKSSAGRIRPGTSSAMTTISIHSDIALAEPALTVGDTTRRGAGQDSGTETRIIGLMGESCLRVKRTMQQITSYQISLVMRRGPSHSLPSALVWLALVGVKHASPVTSLGTLRRRVSSPRFLSSRLLQAVEQSGLLPPPFPLSTFAYIGFKPNIHFPCHCTLFSP